jgi:hypothetical protein
MKMHCIYKNFLIACAVSFFCIARLYPAETSQKKAEMYQNNLHTCRTTRGALVRVWETHSVEDKDIYADRTEPSGTQVWQNAPICIHEFRGDQTHPKAVPAADDGVFVVWQSDSAGKNNINLWCRHIAADGSLTWATPVPVSTAPKNQTDHVVAPDIDGGFFVAWVDYRDDNADIYGQYIQADGSPAGTEDGVPIEIAPGNQTEVRFTFTTNNIVKGIAWKDHSSPLEHPALVETDISRIPVPEPSITSILLIAVSLFFTRKRL